MKGIWKILKLHNEDPQQIRRETKWLWTRICRHKGLIAAVAAVSLVGTVMGLGSSVFSKYLIDAVTGMKTQSIWSAAVWMALLMVGSIALRGVSSRIGASVHMKVYTHNQRKIYKRILQAGWEALEPYRSGDLLHRLNTDVSTVSDGIISALPNLLTVGVRFAGAFVIMLVFDPSMALVALLGIPVSLGLSRLLMGRLRQHNKLVKELGSELMSFQEDSFRNLTSIKSFSITGLFSDNLRKLQGTYSDAYMSYNASQIRISTILSLISTLVSGVCFGWGVYRLWAGAMTFGSLTMFMQLAAVLRSSFSSLISLMQQWVSLLTSAGRIMAVEDLPEEDNSVPQGLTEEETLSVCLRQTAFSYQDGMAVLHPFDFTAAPGDMIAITGPSGEGKTTLLRLLLGLVQPCEGSALLSGGSGRQYPLTAGTRCVFAYVPQGNSIFAGTVAQNLRMVRPEATDAELIDALKTACAWEFVKEFPDGLEHRLGAGGRGVSEGQAQRLAIARALLRNAPVLLLDEATSAMDIRLEQKLMENLRSCGQIRTCVLVTHRPASTRFCNRAYEVNNGVVTEVTENIHDCLE